MKKTLNILLIVLLALGLVACGGSNKKENAEKDAKENNTAVAEDAKNNSNEDMIKVDIDEEGDTIKAIKEKGKIVLGTSADYPPMEWISYDGGKEEYKGVDIEIAKTIANSLGVELEVKNMAFEGLIASLKSGDVDFVLAGMAADEDRKKEVDFSEPYIEGEQVLLVLDENKDKYKTFDDLEGKTIGTQLGSIQQKFAEEKYGSNVKGFDLNNVIIEQLKNKSIDVAFLSEIPAKQFASIADGLSIVGDLGIEKEPGQAVATKKGDDDLTKAISKIVKELKDSGQVDKWLDEYIEISNEEAGK
ncbi:transporter substrate-binding domain-containing protein [Peptoniphilus sp.]|jgi:ABC-type amino acid transport substrate-binding protein|uniref:transporter substrate-binding domain-containing protein n=1 Tax=Peptoniphilus sp. TaxID=1971214 RepID=UPI003D8BE2C4